MKSKDQLGFETRNELELNMPGNMNELNTLYLLKYPQKYKLNYYLLILLSLLFLLSFTLYCFFLM